jgi:hypothetical protein
LGAWETQKSRLEKERGPGAYRLLYFDIGNGMSIVIVALSALCICLAYDLTRITGGAPRAWYVIIAAFAVLSISRVIEAYFDIVSQSSDIDLGETMITLTVVVLFALGLFMLDRMFREQFKVAQDSKHS